MRQVIFTILLCMPLIASATNIEVTDSCVETDYATRMHSFLVSYNNPNLPTGSKAEIIYGFKTEGCYTDESGNSACETFDWDSTAFSKSTIESNLPNFIGKIVSPSAQSGGRYLALQFVLKITLPDKNVIWENANSNYGYYEANFPDACGPQTQVVVQSVPK
jgi:hypothetical protein